MKPELSVAAVQPACTAMDVTANARAHADAIRAARARVVVFPELSITGYRAAGHLGGVVSARSAPARRR